MPYFRASARQTQAPEAPPCAGAPRAAACRARVRRPSRQGHRRPSACGPASWRRGRRAPRRRAGGASRPGARSAGPRDAAARRAGPARSRRRPRLYPLLVLGSEGPPLRALGRDLGSGGAAAVGAPRGRGFPTVASAPRRPNGGPRLGNRLVFGPGRCLHLAHPIVSPHPHGPTAISDGAAVSRTLA